MSHGDHSECKVIELSQHQKPNIKVGDILFHSESYLASLSEDYPIKMYRVVAPIFWSRHPTEGRDMWFAHTKGYLDVPWEWAELYKLRVVTLEDFRKLYVYFEECRQNKYSECKWTQQLDVGWAWRHYVAKYNPGVIYHWNTT